ncbi:MAG: hypothetical protein R3195_08595 [Gemmatimonadota bacterium]|nr:hypothetical protein [Gemmatimonadota bacterium]
MTLESDRFTRYLIGAPASTYVGEWYAAGLARYPDRFATRGRLDAVLLAMSRWRWFPVRSADVTARFVAPGGALRRRLVYLTAILENAPEAAPVYEVPTARSRTAFFTGLAGRGVVSGVALLLGLVVVGLGLIAGVGR